MKILHIGFTTALALAGLAAQAHDLTVEVRNTRGDQGVVNGALYAGGTTWLKTPLQGLREPVTGMTVLVFRNLPAGTYALSLFQDENGNDKLDRNVAGTPLERYGFSRDAQGQMGPPVFPDAAVELAGDTTITVTLR
jgi:uncharacterized protein (DUF2141 family)